MNTHQVKSLTAVALAAAALACSSLTAAAPPPISKEQREMMAQAHEKVAQCLRSERDIAECRQETMRASHTMMGEDGCKMMEGKKMKSEQAGPSAEDDTHKH